MQKSEKIAWIGFLTVLLLPVAGYAYVSYLFNHAEERVAMVHSTRGHRVEIVAPWWWELNRPLIAEVKVKGKQFNPDSSVWIGSIDPDISFNELNFNLLESKGGDAIGLVENSKPDEILLLCDAQSGSVVSACDSGENAEKEAQEILQKVQLNYPHRILVVSRSTGGLIYH